MARKNFESKKGKSKKERERYKPRQEKAREEKKKKETEVAEKFEDLHNKALDATRLSRSLAHKTDQIIAKLNSPGLRGISPAKIERFQTVEDRNRELQEKAISELELLIALRDNEGFKLHQVPIIGKRLDQLLKELTLLEKQFGIKHAITKEVRDHKLEELSDEELLIMEAQPKELKAFVNYFDIPELASEMAEFKQAIIGGDEDAFVSVAAKLVEATEELKYANEDDREDAITKAKNKLSELAKGLGLEEAFAKLQSEEETLKPLDRIEIKLRIKTIDNALNLDKKKFTDKELQPIEDAMGQLKDELDEYMKQSDFNNLSADARKLLMTIADHVLAEVAHIEKKLDDDQKTAIKDSIEEFKKYLLPESPTPEPPAPSYEATSKPPQTTTELREALLPKGGGKAIMDLKTSDMLRVIDDFIKATDNDALKELAKELRDEEVHGFNLELSLIVRPEAPTLSQEELEHKMKGDPEEFGLVMEKHMGSIIRAYFGREFHYKDYPMPDSVKKAYYEIKVLTDLYRKDDGTLRPLYIRDILNKFIPKFENACWSVVRKPLDEKREQQQQKIEEHWENSRMRILQQYADVLMRNIEIVKRRIGNNKQKEFQQLINLWDTTLREMDFPNKLKSLEDFNVWREQIRNALLSIESTSQKPKSVDQIKRLRESGALDEAQLLVEKQKDIWLKLDDGSWQKAKATGMPFGGLSVEVRWNNPDAPPDTSYKDPSLNVIGAVDTEKLLRWQQEVPRSVKEGGRDRTPPKETKKTKPTSNGTKKKKKAKKHKAKKKKAA